MSEMCGVSIPQDLAEALLKHENDPEASKEIGYTHAEKQIENLLSEGVEGVHLYALNSLETVKRLGPKLRAAAGTSSA
jgi:methylenetetrahydrofolate reductase (NADPH)